VRRPELIVFDGDDTLWISEPLYDAARDAAGLVVAAAGVDPVRWDALQRARDLENVRAMGLSADRFPISCREAYEQLAAESGSFSVAVAAAVESEARSVFEAVAELTPGAREVIPGLARTCRLALLTKGDRTVQARRIADSGLADSFSSVRIVDHQKHPRDFADLAAEAGVAPGAAWSVGNSIRSDVVPAMAAGLAGIWIDSYVWEHERHDAADVPEGVVELRSLHDVRALYDASPPR
jgi:putative hydrolase of the HAD superfamily